MRFIPGEHVVLIPPTDDNRSGWSSDGSMDYFIGHVGVIDSIVTSYFDGVPIKTYRVEFDPVPNEWGNYPSRSYWFCRDEWVVSTDEYLCMTEKDSRELDDFFDNL